MNLFFFIELYNLIFMQYIKLFFADLKCFYIGACQPCLTTFISAAIVEKNLRQLASFLVIRSCVVSAKITLIQLHILGKYISSVFVFLSNNPMRTRTCSEKDTQFT